jgi:hypothetical protein
MHDHLKCWIVSLTLTVLAAGCTAEVSESPADSTASTGSGALVAAVIEASCGECQFDLEGDDCDLAVRIDGVAYFVDGTSIDEHGDAHADDGFCNAILDARVTGKIEGDRFMATSFELLPSGE